MNSVIMMGRFVKDPEVRSTTGGMTIATFDIAVDRNNKESKPQADFFRCVTFGKPAEVIEKYFTKGKPILLNGRLQNDNYKDKDGKMQYRTSIIVERFEFVGSRSEKTEKRELPKDKDGFMDIAPEDLPFM